MGTSGWTNEDNEITIPADAAGTDRPRIVITGQAPEGGYPLDAAILFYWNRTDYWYMGITNFGDPVGGYFVRGFKSATSGDEDHTEELYYGNDSRQVDSERYIGNQGASGHVIELIGDGDYRVSASGTLRRSAAEYQIEQAGAPVPESQGMMDIGAGGATPGITTTETVVGTLTQNQGDIRSSRKYRIEFMGRWSSSIAGDRARFRIRRTNAAGALEADFGELTCPAISTPVPFYGWFIYTGLGNVGETLVLTCARTSGTGTITYAPISSAWTDATSSTLS